MVPDLKKLNWKIQNIVGKYEQYICLKSNQLKKVIIFEAFFNNCKAVTLTLPQI